MSELKAGQHSVRYAGDTFAAKVEAVCRTLSCSVCIHDYTSEVEVCAGSTWGRHLNPFCTAVKRDSPTREQRCRRCDIDLVKDRLARSPEPFLKYCHCEVVEVVVPVLYRSMLLGTVFAGPFRWSDDEPLPDTALEQDRPARLPRPIRTMRSALPVLGRPRVVDYGAICQMLSDSLSRLVARSRTKPPEERGHAELISAFFAARFAEPVRICDLATYLCLSESRVSQLLRLHTGATFPQLLKRARLDHARVLLERSWSSITQVAAMCGYADPTYFHRVFKEEFGMAPRAWRRKHMAPGGRMEA
jgi:AraC-like DNA-binding protein